MRPRLLLCLGLGSAERVPDQVGDWGMGGERGRSGSPLGGGDGNGARFPRRSAGMTVLERGRTVFERCLSAV